MSAGLHREIRTKSAFPDQDHSRLCAFVHWDLTQRRVILDRLIEAHRRRIANTAGDSVLATAPTR
jgi:hypothetical protein